jgi:hypothetical protein
MGFPLGWEFFQGLQEKRTSAAVGAQAITAQLNPCPSSRDAFSLSMLAFAPGRALCAECVVASAQANSLLNLYGPTKQAAENAGFEKKAALSGSSRFHYTAVMYGLKAVPFVQILVQPVKGTHLRG